MCPAVGEKYELDIASSDRLGPEDGKLLERLVSLLERGLPEKIPALLGEKLVVLLDEDRLNDVEVLSQRPVETHTAPVVGDLVRVECEDGNACGQGAEDSGSWVTEGAREVALGEVGPEGEGKGILGEPNGLEDVLLAVEKKKRKGRNMDAHKQGRERKTNK